MGMFDNIRDKAQQAMDSNPEKVEQFSDQALDRAADAAGNATGGKFDSQIQQGRDAADNAIGGNEQAPAEGEQPPA